MKKKPLILIGAGGHAKSCIDVIENDKKYYIFGVIDNTKKREFMGYKILGNDTKLKNYIKKIKNVIIGVGQIKDYKKRLSLFKKCKNLGFKLPVIISNKSYVSKRSTIDEGTFIFRNVVINSSVKIGKNCIINSSALIEHDVEIGNNCHISTGCILNGSVKVGQNSFIGSKSVISNDVKIKPNSFIKLGSKVY